MAARACKWGPLKRPTKRRRCRKRPPYHKVRAVSAEDRKYMVGLGGARRRRRRRRR